MWHFLLSEGDPHAFFNCLRGGENLIVSKLSFKNAKPVNIHNSYTPYLPGGLLRLASVPPCKWRWRGILGQVSTPLSQGKAFKNATCTWLYGVSTTYCHVAWCLVFMFLISRVRISSWANASGVAVKGPERVEVQLLLFLRFHKLLIPPPSLIKF